MLRLIHGPQLLPQPNEVDKVPHVLILYLCGLLPFPLALLEACHGYAMDQLYGLEGLIMFLVPKLDEFSILLY